MERRPSQGVEEALLSMLTVGTQKPRYLTGEEQKAACGECIRMILSYCEMLQQEAAALMSVQLITH